MLTSEQVIRLNKKFNLSQFPTFSYILNDAKKRYGSKDLEYTPTEKLFSLLETNDIDLNKRHILALPPCTIVFACSIFNEVLLILGAADIYTNFNEQIDTIICSEPEKSSFMEDADIQGMQILTYEVLHALFETDKIFSTFDPNFERN